MKEFDEREHPRDKDGKFTDSNGKSNKEKLVEAESIYNTEPAQAPISKSAHLTKQEWAMFYERIGKIKKEGHYVPKTEKGDMLIPIETKDSNVLVIASGTYQNPKVKFTVRCKSNAHLYKIIDKLENL
ncbi:MAG: hypothetical protein K2N30_04330 [Clostridia bacterium]|nr:hypothetical protein [Clostridia bacterium]